MTVAVGDRVETYGDVLDGIRKRPINTLKTEQRTNYRMYSYPADSTLYLSPSIRSGFSGHSGNSVV